MPNHPRGSEDDPEQDQGYRGHSATLARVQACIAGQPSYGLRVLFAFQVPTNLPESLALLNACLNGIAAVLLVLAWCAILGRNIERHRKLMISALLTSALFLASYLTRIVIAGDTKFSGQGPVRAFYFALLISHVVLAIGVLPFILRTFYLGLKDQRAKHRKIARWTLPVWLYVSITGVLVYFMLYQFY